MNKNTIIFCVLTVLSLFVVLFQKRNMFYHFDEEIKIDQCVGNIQEGKVIPSKLALINTSYKWRSPDPDIINYNLVKQNTETGIVYCLPQKNNVVPILLNVHPDSLFGWQRGIYTPGKYQYLTHEKSIFRYWYQLANYKFRSRWSEREVTMFTNDEEPFNVGLRVKGNATRSFPQKSLRLIARKEYGSKKVHVKWFSDSINKYDNLIISTSGNDWKRAVMRDPYSQLAASGLDIITYPWRYSELYINGEYWGLHYVSPRVDDKYLKDYLAEKEMYIFEDNLTLYKGKEELFQHFVKSYKLFKKIQESSIEELSELVDLSGLIDYTIFETFANNQDWPYHNFRAYGVKDQPIKFILNDLDMGWGAVSNYEIFETLKLGNCFFSELLSQAMKNESFRDKLNKRYEALAAGMLSTDKLLSQLDQMESELESLMPQQIMRWRTHTSMNDWRKEVDVIRYFITNRHKIYKQKLQEFIWFYE